MNAETAASDLGATLHQARESRGIPLARIAAVTNIPTSILQGLERNEISRLPRGLLGRGFVRSFAAEVGVDPEAAVAMFVTQFPAEAVVAGYPPVERRLEDEAAARRPDRRMPVAVATGAVLLLTAVPLYVATTRTRPHFTAGAINSPSGEPSRASAVAAAPLTPAPSTLFAVPAERNARLLDATAVAAMPAIAIARPGLVPPTSAARSDDQSAADVSSTGANISVVVAATHRSWIIGTANGERVLNRLMEEGEEETITGRDLTVTAGDAGAVAIAVNGAPATPLGRPGQVGTAHINGVHLKKRQQSR